MDSKIIMLMRIIGFLNRYLLQFFFMRIARHVDSNYFSIMYWVIPFSGYKGRPYQYLGNLKRFKIIGKI